MASKTYYFKGTINWAKIQKPDEKFDVYTLDLHLDEESFKMFKDSGLQLKVRENDKDGEYIKLRRPVSKKGKDGLIDLGPPQVLLKNPIETNEDGSPIYSKFDGLVGNGSKGVCKVRVYDTERGKGHELVTVAIDDLVVYEESVGGEEFPF